MSRRVSRVILLATECDGVSGLAGRWSAARSRTGRGNGSSSAFGRRERVGRGKGECERICSLGCGGAKAGAARARGWGAAAAAVTGCTCGGECGEGDETAAGPDRRRVWTAGSTAAVKALNGCKLMPRTAGESANSVRPACCDRARDAATKFAASVSREGWPNGAGEA